MIYRVRPVRHAPYVRRRPVQALGALEAALSPGQATVAIGTPESNAQYQADSLAELRNISKWQQQWVEKDQLQRWIQIGATVAIPVFAVLWKKIGKALARGESD